MSKSEPISYRSGSTTDAPRADAGKSIGRRIGLIALEVTLIVAILGLIAAICLPAYVGAPPRDMGGGGGGMNQRRGGPPGR